MLLFLPNVLTDSLNLKTMNQLLKDNNLQSTRFKTVLAASGSICALIGTYFLIRNRNHLYELIASIREKKQIKSEPTASKSPDPNQLLNQTMKLDLQAPQPSRERVVNDLKEFNLENNKKPLKDKRKSIDQWWANRDSESKKSSKATFLSKLKTNETDNESDSEQNAETELALVKLNPDELMSKFSTVKLNQKIEIVNLLTKSEVKHLAQLFKMLEASFTEQSNGDLFNKYTFNNTSGELYTDMLVKLLKTINDLTLHTDEPNLKDIFEFYQQIVDLLFGYIYNFEKNNKNNAKRRGKIEKVKYLSLSIMSNLVKNINKNGTQYDSNELKFIEKILTKECDISKLDSNKSVQLQKEATANNSLVYLQLIENLIDCCVHFDIKHTDYDLKSVYSYITSDLMINNLKDYEKDSKFKIQLEKIYEKLADLRDKIRKLNESNESSIVVIKEDEFRSIEEVIAEPEQSRNQVEPNRKSSVKEMQILCSVQEIPIDVKMLN